MHCQLDAVCLHVCLRRLVRARAGKLAWGVKGSNACPAGSSVITDVAQCQAAAATAGKTWRDGRYKSTSPRGCYDYYLQVFGEAFSDNGVYLNTHPTGAAEASSTPLCAVPATGVCACACACVME